MPGKAIGIMLNNGYAGTVSRTADQVIQNRIAKTDIAFGQAVILNAENTYSLPSDSTQAADIAGVAVREVVQANTYDPQSNPDYLAGRPCDVLVRGQATVVCKRGTPAAGRAVYVRTKLNGSYSDSYVGDFEAEADGSNSVQVSNIEWSTGTMDSNRVAEITIKSRAKG